jgi:hypothetical protein
MRGRRLRSTRAVLIAAAALVSTIFSLAGIVPAAQAAVTLEAVLYPASGCVVTPSSSCPVTVRVTNTSASSASNVIASLSASTSLLDSVDETNTWFRASNSVIGSELGLSSLELGTLPAGQSVSVTTKVSLSVSDFGSAWGVVGLNADLEANGVGLATARTALIWEPAPVPSRASLSTIVPLVPPASLDAFLSVSDLANLVSPGGLLDAQLSAATNSSAIAVDPRIIASILRAGDAAPPAATQWLARLNSLTQPSIQLQYADADFALEGQVGFAETIDFSVDGVGSLTQAQLAAAWTPSIQNAFWAEPNTLTSSSLVALRAGQGAGASSPVLLLAGSTNADASDATRVDLYASPDPTSFNTIVVNDPFSASLRAAEASTTNEEWLRSASEASAYVAVVAGNGGGHLVGGFSRGLSAEASYRTAQTQDFLRSLPWAQPISLVAALEQPSRATVLVETPESAERLAGGASVFSHYSDVGNFAVAASSPEAVFASAGRLALPALSVAWMGVPTEWPAALDELSASTAEYLDRVHIGLTSNINMVGGQASIPITVVNEHAFDVTLVVRAVPSNPRLTVGADQTVTLSAESQGTVKIPVAARVGNGDLNLVLSLSTEAGQIFGREVTVPVRVRADWEGVGLVIIAVLFTGLVATGVVRTIRRNRVDAKAAS